MNGCHKCLQMKPNSELIQECYMGQSTYECKSSCNRMSAFPALTRNKTYVDPPVNVKDLTIDIRQYRDGIRRYTDPKTGDHYHHLLCRDEWSKVNETEYDPSDMRVIKLKLFLNASFADLKLAKNQLFDQYIRYEYKGSIIKCHRTTSDWSTE